MNLSRIFIERPVMTALVTFAILLFGIVAYRALPVAALPRNAMGKVMKPEVAGLFKSR